VSIVRCTRAGRGSWWLLLRCGGCGTWHETSAQDEAVARLQRAIEHGRNALAESALCLDQERMILQVEAFSRALDLDLIGAEDF
jgi:hypothetical protein